MVLSALLLSRPLEQILIAWKQMECRWVPEEEVVLKEQHIDNFKNRMLQVTKDGQQSLFYERLGVRVFFSSVWEYSVIFE